MRLKNVKASVPHWREPIVVPKGSFYLDRNKSALYSDIVREQRFLMKIRRAQDAERQDGKP